MSIVLLSLVQHPFYTKQPSKRVPVRCRISDFNLSRQFMDNRTGSPALLNGRIDQVGKNVVAKVKHLLPFLISIG